MHARSQDVLDAIRTVGQLYEELTKKHVAAIESYNATFAAEHAPVGAGV
jgi:hypothetical protein